MKHSIPQLDRFFEFRNKKLYFCADHTEYVYSEVLLVARMFGGSRRILITTSFRETKL
jgi:hypothetical protein